MKRIRSALLISLLALLVGCSTVYDSNKITAVKTRCFGLIVETSSTSANGTPSIKLGFVSQVVQIIPTATNQMYAPPYVDTFDLGQSINPMDTKISEDTGTGFVASGTNIPAMKLLGARFQKPVPVAKTKAPVKPLVAPKQAEK